MDATSAFDAERSLSPSSGPRVLVIGAGAFGGWTALELLRRGAHVTLVDAWGPGNVRASSGGETRIIRATYGSRAIYTRMTRRALARWRAFERPSHPLLHLTGVLWLFGDDDRYAHASAAALHAEGARFDPIDRADAIRRYPQIDFAGIASVYVEPDAGYLFARRACAEVVERFIAEGGTYRLGAVLAPAETSAALDAITLTDGTSLSADAFVFACGPWLRTLFPDLLGPHLTATRQEVYYFGLPAGDPSFTDRQLPVWIDMSDRQIYGIPTSTATGFKVADDTPGPPIDPSTAERTPGAAGVAAARAFLARRFPRLGSAPLVGAEVCQYEASPDANFIVDRLPDAANVWIAGGGSGHGFKMGPVVGEMVAALVLGEREPEAPFALARLIAPPAAGWQEKWT